MKTLLKRKRLTKRSLSQIIKSDETTREELERLCKSLNIDVNIKWLSQYSDKDKKPQILNMGDILRGGTHWCAVYNDQYFDPFGIIPPSNIKAHWIPLQIQDISTGGCGGYCVLWLYYMMRGEQDQFYNLFC